MPAAPVCICPPSSEIREKQVSGLADPHAPLMNEFFDTIDPILSCGEKMMQCSGRNDGEYGGEAHLDIYEDGMSWIGGPRRVSSNRHGPSLQHRSITRSLVRSDLRGNTEPLENESRRTLED
jgi:hypothetical protein